MGLFRSAPQAALECSGDSCRKLWKGIDPQWHLVLVADEGCRNGVRSTPLSSSFEASLIMLPSTKYGRAFRQEKARAFSCPISYNRLSCLMITCYGKSEAVCHPISRHQM